MQVQRNIQSCTHNTWLCFPWPWLARFIQYTVPTMEKDHASSWQARKRAVRQFYEHIKFWALEMTARVFAGLRPQLLDFYQPRTPKKEMCRKQIFKIALTNDRHTKLRSSRKWCRHNSRPFGYGRRRRRTKHRCVRQRNPSTQVQFLGRIKLAATN